MPSQPATPFDLDIPNEVTFDPTVPIEDLFDRVAKAAEAQARRKAQLGLLDEEENEEQEPYQPLIIHTFGVDPENDPECREIMQLHRESYDQTRLLLAERANMKKRKEDMARREKELAEQQAAIEEARRKAKEEEVATIKKAQEELRKREKELRLARIKKADSAKKKREAEALKKKQEEEETQRQEAAKKKEAEEKEEEERKRREAKRAADIAIFEEWCKNNTSVLSPKQKLASFQAERQTQSDQGSPFDYEAVAKMLQDASDEEKERREKADAQTALELQKELDNEGKKQPKGKKSSKKAASDKSAQEASPQEKAIVPLTTVEASPISSTSEHKLDLIIANVSKVQDTTNKCMGKLNEHDRGFGIIATDLRCFRKEHKQEVDCFKSGLKEVNLSLIKSENALKETLVEQAEIKQRVAALEENQKALGSEFKEFRTIVEQQLQESTKAIQDVTQAVNTLMSNLKTAFGGPSTSS